MKKSFFLMASAALFSFSVYAQEKTAPNVPAAVMTAFKAKFPKIINLTWDKENAEKYEAEFKVNGTTQSAKFDKTGKWIETETDIKITDLPKAVSQAVTKNFAAYKITEASKVESVKYGNGYKVEIQKDKESYDVLLSANGNVLSKEAETEEKDDDN